MDIPIHAENLRKVYIEGSVEVVAVESADISVNKGEVVGIVGPSGSGKTTLLSMLGCILKPTGGNIKIYGQDIAGLTEDELPFIRRKYFGFIFQGFNLFSPLTAIENVMISLKLKGAPRKEAEEAAHILLEKVGLEERAFFLPRDLSGGQKQRVAIARALVGNPSIILADEPTGNLDRKSGKRVVEILRELVTANNACAVIVTHDSRIYHSLDRVFYMEDGRLRI
jgi:putative ABC transport system ATP-binding protein